MTYGEKTCECDPKHTVMVEQPFEYDGGLYFECWRNEGGCGARWHRWPEGHYLRKKAFKYVEMGHTP